MSKEVMRKALEKIATVNAMDYEYQAWAREALAKPDFWEGYVPEPVKPAQCKYPKCSYPCSDLPDCRDAEQPAQQEPVAFLDWYDNAHWGNEDFKDGCWRAWDAALEHTSPPAKRTWVGLTDEERKLVRSSVGYNQFVTAGEYAEHVQKATEFKLLEKNNG